MTLEKDWLNDNTVGKISICFSISDAMVSDWSKYESIRWSLLLNIMNSNHNLSVNLDGLRDMPKIVWELELITTGQIEG